MKQQLDQKLIGILAQNGDLFGKSLQEIDVTFFTVNYGKIYKILQTYYQKHKKLPTLDILENKLFKEKEILFPKDINTDEIILGVRKFGALTDREDYEFLIEEMKQRKSEGIANQLLPKAVESLKIHKHTDAADILISTGNAMKNALSSEKHKRTNNNNYTDTVINKYKDTKKNPELAWGYKTGFERLDQATHGVGKGEMFLVAARPGNGKSMFLLSVAINMFNQGLNVLYVSIEMATEHMWERVCACYSGIEINKIKEASLTEEEEEKFIQTMEKMKQAENRFEILDAPNITVPTITSEIEQMIDKHKPDVIFIDYLGIVKPTEKGLPDNLAQASVVEELRGLARQKNIGMFTAVQLNRDSSKSKNKTKGTERLARSDVISATIDVGLQIEEFDVEEELTNLSDRVKITAIKNRKGPFPFAFDVRKDFTRGRFLDWNLASWNNLK